ncbi:hypothetical protein B0A50_06302 [Salinomyces thailandicus]|uniref:Calcineurin-like phosphoesterase domain-containing protein n=1 Tax=Salinomyces thailandicus TaxID=706561 RepID=A0A4U0TUF1_9PEZI|nr:hypothetical protein B0A50_06302 [Salinomyces thailandica]
MRLSSFLLILARFLLPPALIGTVYLYLYPIIHQCSFPPARRAEAACYFGDTPRPAVPSSPAPFRLLALADPQLEGDTSLPEELRGGDGWLKGTRDGFWNGVHGGGREKAFDGVRPAVHGFMTEDIPRLFAGYRKKLDLWGNDLYLAHIYWLMHWWSAPTHTVVLGDLLGSQWIDDDEFARRSRRFWGKVFKGGEKVPREVTDVSGRTEMLGQDANWQRRLIAVAGNHDIGYAGDIDGRRIERFEEQYGRVNWDVRFRLNDTAATATRHASALPFAPSSSLLQHPPELRLVILNSMNLDQPAWDQNLHHQSRDFLIESLHSPAATASNSDSQATILLTHIPLHKEKGVCVDAPYFAYFHGGGIQEQNHLSKDVSEYTLDGLLRSSGTNAVVLNGHDHEGCDTYHYHPAPHSSDTEKETAEEDKGWQAEKWRLSPPHRSDRHFKGLREITVRSMMGSYDGNAGLLSAWYEHADENDSSSQGTWRFEYDTCALGVQHIWWAVHVLDLVVILLGLSGVVRAFWEAFSELREEKRLASETRGKRKRG